MLHELLSFIRWLWYAVLLPYVIIALANLVTDGAEALSHVGETMTVMLTFILGRSHRPYPPRRAQLDALTECAVEAFTLAGGTLHTGDTEHAMHSSSHSSVAVSGGVAGHDATGGSSSPSASASAAEEMGDGSPRGPVARSVPHTTRVSLRADRGGRDVSLTLTGKNSFAVPPSSSSSSSARPSTVMALWHNLNTAWEVLIERRLLRGRKGEIQEWLTPAVGHLLVPPAFPLCYDAGLHLLVGSFMGPIQQPTVATLPSRHLAPQWPPHYGARHEASHASALSHLADPSTDDNSSATDMRGSTDSKGSSFARARGTPLTGRRSAQTVARPKFRQVYRRESANNIDLQPRRASSHLIASITSNHVLSYQGTRQKVLVMDLDETLCHVSTSTAGMLGPPTFSEVIPTLAGSEIFHVWERPYVRLFLTTASQLFNLVLFTSASKPYADTILRRIDPHNTIKERYYRQDCRLITRGVLARHLAIEKQRRRRTQEAPEVSEAERTTDGGFSSHTAGQQLADALTSPPALRRAHHTAARPGSPPSTGADDRLRRRLVNRADDGAATNTNTTAGAEAESAVEVTPDKESGVLSRSDHDGVEEASSAAPNLGAAHETPRPTFNENAKVLVKDLRILKVPPELCVMIDNSEECTLLNRENALIIQPYLPSAEGQRRAREANEAGFPAVDPDEDEVLLGILSFLECLLVVPDVRSVLRHGKVF